MNTPPPTSMKLNNQPPLPCPNCSKPLPPGVKLCANCKISLALCTEKNALIRADKPQCEKCGKQLELCTNPTCARKVHENMSFCYFCDTPRKSATAQAAFHEAATTPMQPLVPSSPSSATQNSSNTATNKDNTPKPTSASPSSPTQSSSNGQTASTPTQSSVAPPTQAQSSITPLTLSELEKQLTELAHTSADEYFPGDLQQKATIIKQWEQEIKRALEITRLVKRSRITSVLEDQLRRKLTEATNKLNFARPYEVKLLGHSGAGKSTLLAAILAESVIPRGHGGAITPVPLRFRRCKENENEKEMMYVHFLPSAKRPVAAFERSTWGTVVNRFAIQPTAAKDANAANGAKASTDINEAHLVDYIEFALDGKTHPELPPHVVLVDLPGSQTKHQSHEDIFDTQLSNADAVILVAKTNRPDNKEIGEVVTAVKTKLMQREAGDISLVSRMIFMIATEWDGNNSSKDMKRATDNMNILLATLASDYERHHPNIVYEDFEGTKHPCAFYPMRAEDAFWATMHTHNQIPAQDQSDPVKLYRGRVLALRSSLQKLNSKLPDVTELSSVENNIPYHEAMRQFSGLPRFLDDLRTFLAQSRFDVQLQYARQSLQQALEILDKASWEVLAQHKLNVPIRSVEELDKALLQHGNSRQNRYINEVRARIDQMEPAWEEVCKAFDMAMDTQKNPRNPFLTAITQVHTNATLLILRLIQAGKFDDTISEKGKRTSKSKNSMPGDDLTNTIDLIQFTADLRAHFWEAIEAEIRGSTHSYSPATALADTFLGTLENYERGGERPLDIGHVTFGAVKARSSLQVEYAKIKRDIRANAEKICLAMTASSLHSRHNHLKADNSSVITLENFVKTNSLDDKRELLHDLMKAVLFEMVKDTIVDTKSAIVVQFRYDLDNFLQYREVYYDHRHVANFRPHHGAFRELTQNLRTEMEAYIKQPTNHPELHANLRKMFDQDEDIINRWATIIREIDNIRALQDTTPPPIAVQAA